MTKVRWTAKAADDLADIVNYINQDNPDAARRVAQTIFNGVSELRTFPNRGRIGSVHNTRERVFSPWPYIGVYEIAAHELQVLCIRHASRDWP